MRNDGTPGYYEALRLRKIYCEGNFSHQKAEHNLRRLRKRGLGKAHEHCLLSATALNLKRMVKLLTTRKHPGVSLRKTLSAIGRSSMLYPMALLSTGPFHYSLQAARTWFALAKTCYFPAEGYRLTIISSPKDPKFQFSPPRRGRPQKQTLCAVPADFNSRPRVGGVDMNFTDWYTDTVISILAPA